MQSHVRFCAAAVMKPNKEYFQWWSWVINHWIRGRRYGWARHDQLDGDQPYTSVISGGGCLLGTPGIGRDTWGWPRMLTRGGGDYSELNELVCEKEVKVLWHLGGSLMIVYIVWHWLQKIVLYIFACFNSSKPTLIFYIRRNNSVWTVLDVCIGC